MKRLISIVSVFTAVIALASITACSDGQLREETQKFDVSPPAPVVVSFYADPVEVESGGDTTITWEVLGADSVEITSEAADGSNPLHVETTELSGTAVAKGLTATTNFTITAKYSGTAENSDSGDGGTVAPKSITINAPIPKDDSVAASSDAEDTPTNEANPSIAQGGGTAAPPATETITVKVKSKGVEANLVADKTPLTNGESTIIRWEITPSDADIAVVDSDGNAVEPTFSGEDCDITDPDQLLDSGTPADKPQAKGCAVVTPQKTTVYTVTGTSGDSSNSADVTVDVSEENLSAEILINGEKNAKVDNFDTPVTISWTAKPVGSTVTITADGSVESCDPALPNGQAATEENGSSSCKVNGKTVFTMTVASSVDQTKTAEAMASVEIGNVTADIDIRSDEWGFKGEQVEISITPKANVTPQAIKEIRISDASAQGGIIKLATLPTEPLRVAIPRDGVKVEMDDIAGNTHDYGTRVRSMTTIVENVAQKAKAITALAFDPNNASTRYVGVIMPDWCGDDGKCDVKNKANFGTIKLYKNGADINIPLGKIFEEKLPGLAPYRDDKAFNDKIETFPINTIAVKPGNPDEVYVGTTGALVRTTDGGKTFHVVAPAIISSQFAKDGTHPTCRGATQKGIVASYKNQPVGMNQICDVAVTASGRLVVATDTGAFVLDDVDAFMKGDKNAKIVGHPEKEDSAETEGLLTYGHVVDDVECLDNDCDTVLAATDAGVFKSTDGAKTWSQFGNLQPKAYKLAHLGNEVYAATEDGVYASNAVSASWNRLGDASTPTATLAVDPNEGQFGRMLIAATNSAFAVTRDTGKLWSIIPDPVEQAITASVDIPTRRVAISAMNAKSGKGKLITVLMSEGNKLIFGQTTVGVLQPNATGDDIAKTEQNAGMDVEIIKAQQK